jgi:hypothetical protein
MMGKSRFIVPKVADTFFKRCPKTGRIVGFEPAKGLIYGLLPITGIAALIWYIIRVLPKPSRASYPCQQMAAPMVSNSIVGLFGIAASVFAFNKARTFFTRSRYIGGALCLFAALTTLFVASIQTAVPLQAQSTNATILPGPIGEAKGTIPGRVVWFWDPTATNEACTNGTNDWYWLDKNTNQSVVDNMLNKSLLSLTGQTTTAEAWTSIFTYYNVQKRNLNRGYAAGEKIFIKVNVSSGHSMSPGNYAKAGDQLSMTDVSPQLIISLLSHLVNVAGIPQANISIGDPNRPFYDQYFTKIQPLFPNVKYVDRWGTNGRTPYSPTANNVIFYSDRRADPAGDKLPQSMVDATYLLNVACLKAHEGAGVTLCAKNHYGSQCHSSPYNASLGGAAHIHYSRPDDNGGYYKYRNLVDFMGHKDLGGKTVLSILDGLWGGYMSIPLKPNKWKSVPFNNDWPSSLIMSQDVVAIEAVGTDFVREEYQTKWGYAYAPYPNNWIAPATVNGVEDYMYQAASSQYWPTIVDGKNFGGYDPENDGTPIGSLGVYEHWNNPTEKKYSRNLDLDNGTGIELVALSQPNNMIVNGDFAQGTQNWITDGATTTATAGYADMLITDGGPLIYSVQLRQENIAVTTGTQYTVCFDIKTSQNPRTMKLELDAGAPTYTPMGLTKENVAIGADWTSYTYTFTANATDANTRLCFDVGLDANDVQIDNVSMAKGTTCAGTPPDNSIPVPGRIQAEDYKLGGEAVGYHDLTTGNAGGAYKTDNVDIQATTDVGGGYNVGWTQAGEWLAYDIKVANAGTYTFTARLATGTAGTKTITVTVDGTTKGTFNLTVNNGWQVFSDIVVNNVSLTAGAHELRILLTTADVNVNYLDVTAQSPATPTGLTATAASTSQINLSWTDNATNETGFYVYQSTATAKPATATATLAANTLTYSATGLTASTRYNYWVCAYNANGNSSDATANAATQGPPAAPTALTATASSATQINLGWTDNADNETGFYVYQSTTSIKPATATATLAANAVTFNVTGLIPNTRYYFWVCAYNANGTSSDAIANTMTLDNPPAAPTALSATAAGTTQINLGWTDNAGNETGFYVYQSTASIKPVTATATLAANAVAYSATGLIVNTKYYYWVSAYNANGSSTDAIANATTLNSAPAAPTALSATAPSNTQINLGWTDNAGNETGFYVYQSTTSIKPATATATLAANAVTFNATGLTSSTQYFFWVCAYNVIGNSADAAASATTKPAGVEKVTNGAFTTTIANWTTYKDPAATATIAWNAGTIKATITNGGTQVYHVQFTQAITYTAGMTYSLSFDASSPEGNRNIAVAQEQGSGDYHAIAGSATQAFALTNVTKNYTYQFTSTETNALGRLTFNCGNNAFDVVVDNVSLLESAPVVNPPNAPTGLTATAVSSSRINLSWTDNANNETGFYLYQSTTTTKPSTATATLAANTVSYSATGLTAVTPYFVWVCAYNAVGNSTDAFASATTLDNPPVAPNGLSATAAGTSQINLSWTDNAGNETGFYVYQSTATAKPATATATLAANAVTYSATGLTAGTRYNYWVCAFNANGSSTDATANATTQGPPAAPTTLNALATSTSQINLSWTDNASNETGFYVYRSTSTTKPAAATVTLAANVITYSATGLTANTRYYFWACAYNANGNSADIAANAATKPAGVEKVTNGAFTTNITGWTTYKDPAATATVAWNAGAIKATITNGGAQVYHVQFAQGITYTAGKTYSLSFDAFSPEGNRNISIAQEQGSGDYHAIAGSATQTIALTNTTKNYTYQFTSTESNAGGRLTFNCGNNAFDVVVDNVSLIEQ